MFRATEGVQVGEDGVALDLARVLHPQVVGIGIHTHHLLLHFIGRVGEVDAVAQRFRHLGLAVRTGQTQAGRVVGQQNSRHDECFSIYGVEFMDDFARLFDHRFLILADRYGRGLESGDIRGLADRVGEESYRNTLALRSLFFVAFGEAAQLDFGLHRRIALQTGYGHQVHVVESQLAEFRHLRLDEERRLRGIQSAREIVEGDLEDVLPHFFRVVRIIGQRLGVGDHDEYFLEFARILQLHAAAQRTYVMSQVEFAGRTISGEYDFSHQLKSF